MLVKSFWPCYFQLPSSGSLFYCYYAFIQQVCCRYEDNGDAVNNLLVICKSTGNKSIEDFGSPDKWLQENAKLLGEDVWKGELCVLHIQTGH